MRAPPASIDSGAVGNRACDTLSSRSGALTGAMAALISFAHKQ